MPRSIRLLFVSAGLAGLAGCATTPPPPLVPPATDAQLAYFAGDPIGGPLGEVQATALELHAADTVPVRIRLYLLARAPGDGTTPLSDHVRLIVADGAADPLAAATLLAAGARLATGPEAAALADAVAALPPDRAVLATAFDGLVPPGVTLSLTVRDQEPIALPDLPPAERSIGVELWHADASSDELSIALVLAGVVEAVQETTTSAPVVVARPRHERIVLDARLPGADRPLAVLTARPTQGARRSWLLVLEVLEPPADEPGLAALDQRLAGVREAIQDAAAGGADRRRPLQPDERRRLVLSRALEALDDPGHRRAALLELADRTSTLAELALLADDDQLAELCTRLQGQAEDAALLRELAADGDALAWHLEQATLRMLAGRLDRGDLPPELEALLLRRAGEAARYPGALEDALAASHSLAGLAARLMEENRIALEDSSPAARMRARDWLRARGVEVPGYDPLAERRARREALSAWSEAEAEGSGVPAGADGR